MTSEKPVEDIAMELESMVLTDLDLTARAYNCLKRAGVNNLRILVEHSEEQLLCIPSFGQRTLEHIQEELEMNGLSLGMFATSLQVEK